MRCAQNLLVVVCLIVLLSAHARAQKPADFKQANTAENLKQFFEIMQAEIHREKNLDAAAAMFKSMIPDEPRLDKALKPDIAPETRASILAFHKKMGIPSAAMMPHMMKAEQTKVLVHPATTEEIIAYTKGSTAWKEFPGGARTVAEKALRPKMTFYEVEFLEPGKEYGMKHHLFYWDGTRWTILGPVWRGLK